MGTTQSSVDQPSRVTQLSLNVIIRKEDLLHGEGDVIVDEIVPDFDWGSEPTNSEDLIPTNISGTPDEASQLC
jgi:hypothetical protein